MSVIADRTSTFLFDLSVPWHLWKEISRDDAYWMSELAIKAVRTAADWIEFTFGRDDGSHVDSLIQLLVKAEIPFVVSFHPRET